jgi:hypothetical protein
MRAGQINDGELVTMKYLLITLALSHGSSDLQCWNETCSSGWYSTPQALVSSGSPNTYECYTDAHGNVTNCELLLSQNASPDHNDKAYKIGKLYDTKDACMAALKGISDPTQGYCVGVNGFSRELKPY